jgi:hypothetical protein
MASTLIGVIYSISQARVRQWIIPDDDKELDGYQPSPGEAFFTYLAKLGHDTATINAQVKAVTGRDPDDDTCAVVAADGSIVALVKADPAIDTHPDGDVVATGGPISRDALYNAKTSTFTLDVPASTVRAGTILKDGTVVAQDIVEPAQTLAISFDPVTKLQAVELVATPIADEPLA